VYSDPKGTGLINKMTSTDHRSLVQLQLAEFSDRDSGTCVYTNMAGCHGNA
jgi:hypothetical protein